MGGSAKSPQETDLKEIWKKPPAQHCPFPPLFYSLVIYGDDLYPSQSPGIHQLLIPTDFNTCSHSPHPPKKATGTFLKSSTSSSVCLHCTPGPHLLWLQTVPKPPPPTRASTHPCPQA